jgi:hypothetical protein
MELGDFKDVDANGGFGGSGRLFRLEKDILLPIWKR